MLRSYEAIYEKGQLKWLNEQPTVDSARVIVTVLEVEAVHKKRRVPPIALAGKVKITGDIVGPIVDEQDWECLK